MVSGILALIFLIITFLVTAGGNGLRRLVGLHAERQMRRRLRVSFRIYRAAFDRRAAQGAVLTAIVAMNCLRFLVTLCGLLFILDLSGWPPQGIILAAEAGEILLLLALLLWVDLMARAWSHANPERAVAVAAPLLGPFLVALFPLTYPILRGSRLLRPTGSRIQLREELGSWLEELEMAGSIDRSSKQLLEAAGTFHQRMVREVMVPRNEIFALPAQMGLQEAMHQLLHEAYSRVPIYDGTLDTITGILLHKDLLRRVAEQPSDAPISHLAKPPLFVPETKAMDELLHELRRRRTHMAIVVDEYGTTAGIVTIEDLLEELVGDIADEHDIDERELIQPHPQGGWIVQARITIAQLEEELSIQFPHQTAYDTLAGYLVHRIGSIPRKGFHLQLEQFDLEILASTARSIDVVRIVPRPTEE